MEVPTMKIKGGANGFIVINVSDFDPNTMEKYEDPQEQTAAVEGAGATPYMSPVPAAEARSVASPTAAPKEAEESSAKEGEEGESSRRGRRG